MRFVVTGRRVLVTENGSKRARTRRTLLANAIALFERDGVGATRLGTIADAAGVVKATLANHFPTRSALVDAWLREELAAIVLDEIDLGRDRRLRSPLRQVARRTAALSAGAPRVRLEGWRLAPRASASSTPAIQRLAALIRAEQQSEHVRADLPALDLAHALWDALEGGLVAGLERLSVSARRTDESTEAALARSIQARVDLVLDGARRRNERVRAPAASAQPSLGE